MSRIKTSAGINRYHWDKEDFEYLVSILQQAKTFPDILNLFIDLHTPKEISEIVRRVIIASYLHEYAHYDEIYDLTRASRNTIAKMNQKMWRQKSILGQLIAKAGTHRKFIKKRSKKSETFSDSIIDATLAKRDALGIFFKHK